MNMVIIGIVIFGVIWIWIGFQMFNAPLLDDNEIPIKPKPKSRRAKRKFHIDNLDEGELYEELYRRNDQKDDIK